MMNEPLKPGITETATLKADGTIVIEHFVIYPDDDVAHGDEIVKPGTPRYQEVLANHPNLKVDEPQDIHLPLPARKEDFNSPA